MTNIDKAVSQFVSEEQQKKVGSIDFWRGFHAGAKGASEAMAKALVIFSRDVDWLEGR